MFALTNTNLEDHGRIATSLEAADELSLFEGLPHQHFYAELLQSELESKSTVEIGKFPFYAEPSKLSATDRLDLAEFAKFFGQPRRLQQSTKRATTW